jgi:hypothetical protein
MFEHLISPDFDTPEALPPSELASAAVRTMNWLDQPIEDPSPNAKSLARSAFAGLTDPSASPAITTKSILALRAPAAVRHLVDMLSAYDWDFVQQAAEIRGYIVKELLEASQNPDNKVKLKALGMLGTVTEVGAFTQRSEVAHKQEPAGDVEDRIRARLKAMLPPQQPTDDVEVKEIAVIRHEPPPPAAK